VLERDIKDVAIVTQRESPTKIYRVTDEQFLKYEPEPTDTGNPVLYRLWEISGVGTKLSTADTIDVVSSSTSDDNDSDLAVTIWGYVNGILQSESYVLNGTTTVTGSTTFDARDIFVSKSKNTTGTITITAGATTLTTLGKEERNPIHKVMDLYPIPGSAMTIYIQYYSHLRELVRDSDVPQFDPNWHYVIRLGTLAKVYQFLGKENDFTTTQALYSASVRAMVNADRGVSDFIPRLERHRFRQFPHIRRSTADVA